MLEPGIVAAAAQRRYVNPRIAEGRPVRPANLCWMGETRAPTLFLQCEDAIRKDVLITRESSRDKEFAVQDWVQARLDDAGLSYEESGRNTYPDFPLTGDPPEGFEVKSLAYPGRDASYDANSQPPCGVHGGRTVFYVFVRYPRDGGNRYPVYDLVICHGDFLNPARDYEHVNDNVPNFGVYGDIMIRDRKMYVVRTPYAIAEGLAGQRTLVLPSGWAVPDSFKPVGAIERREADEVAVGYEFDLKASQLHVISEQNPTAGKVHIFRAYRPEDGTDDPVVLAALPTRRRRRT
ncbi:MAG TPA: hypothetical protein VGH60_07705 [Solirubrobacteraceae bacterium]